MSPWGIASISHRPFRRCNLRRRRRRRPVALASISHRPFRRLQSPRAILWRRSPLLLQFLTAHSDGAIAGGSPEAMRKDLLQFLTAHSDGAMA